MMASCFTFEKLYRAYRDCLKHKRSKPTALAFSVKAPLIDSMVALISTKK